MEEILCGFCRKKPAEKVCEIEECGKPICEECKKEIVFNRPGQQVQGVQTSSLKFGTEKHYICSDCNNNNELDPREYFLERPPKKDKK